MTPTRMGVKMATIPGSTIAYNAPRVHEAGVASEETLDGVLVRDPSQNCLLLASATEKL